MNESITLVAQWKEKAHFTVQFVTGEGASTVAPVTVAEGGKLTKPADPTRAHYTFDGWYVDADLTVAYDFNAVVTGQLTLHAKWIAETFTVTFYADAETQTVHEVCENIPYGGTATVNSAPIKTGYIFVGWYTANGGEYDFGAVTADLDVYAKWSPVNPQDPAIYYVTFDWQYDDLKTVVAVNENEIATAPVVPSRGESWVFGGWYNEAACMSEYTFGAVTQNATAYAKWIEKSAQPDAKETVYVTYLLDGAVHSVVSVEKGSTVEEPSIDNKVGHTFDGWYKNDTEDKFAFGTETVESNLTLKASWTPNPMKVTFDYNDGTGRTQEQTVPYGTKAIALVAERAGYTFGGWYLGDTAYDFGAVTDHITLTAKWNVNEYTVTFNANGGTLADETLATQTVAFGGFATAPVAEREGYTFAGWYVGEEEFDFSKPVAGDVAVYAKWVVKT